MKIFITGIAGFLGANLADHFLKLGHEVHGCDNLIGGDLKITGVLGQVQMHGILLIHLHLVPFLTVVHFHRLL